jgi:hypothetical protein
MMSVGYQSRNGRGSTVGLAEHLENHMKLEMATKFAKHFKAKLSTCCGDPVYIDVTESAVRKLLKPYLKNEQDEGSTFEQQGRPAWSPTTITSWTVFGITETLDDRCGCDDASIATLDTSTRTMTVGW